MSIWWLNNTVRVAREKEAVENLAIENEWFVFDRWEIHDYNFAATGSIVAHGATYPVRLVYPDNFPLVPAWVEPQDPEAKWSYHQYGKGGALCLELRPDNWTSRATGADVLRSAYGLLNLENPLGEGEKGNVTSAHNVGEIQQYNWGESPVFIGSECQQRLIKGEAEDLEAVRWATSDKVLPIYLSDAIDRSFARRPPSIDIDSWRFPVPLVMVQGAPPDNLPLKSSAFIATLWGDEAPVTPGAMFVTVFIGEREITVYSVWEESAYHRKVYVLPPEMGVRSGRAPSAHSKKVAIIGAGSVGSKVAEMLLRSGIDNLRIFDGDVFLPGNLERHVLDWRDVGYHKVHGLKRRLLHIVPGANILTVDQNLNWQKSAKTNALHFDLITGCDIIVDASGDPGTSMLLGALAFENEKPFVSIEVFEGGIGALVAPFVPKRNAAYTLGREALLNWTDEKGQVPLSAGGRAYEAVGDNGEIVVADDAAISMAASHAARVVLDILDEKLEDFRWLLIGFRREWAFYMHGHVIALDVGGPSDWNNISEDAEALKFVIEIAGELTDAIKALAK